MMMMVSLMKKVTFSLGPGHNHFVFSSSSPWTCSTVMLTLFLCQLIFTSSAAAFISGKAIKCLNEGENVKVSFLYNDPCIQCKCKNQEIVCEREACSQGKKCTHNGKVYKSGETWKNATCNHCTCSSGLIACQAEVCERDLTCHEKAKKVHLAGDCCPSCAENDGLCTLTSSGHDVNTLALKSFDDHRSNFSGQCNYVLARDCDKKTFVVHILRDRQANDTDTLFAIVVKVGQTKVRLSRTTTDKGWRLRVGRRPELLPHIKLGVLSVLKDDKGVLVRTNIGVKVTWSSDDVIAVTVPSKYKGKTCGLCGNYNELAEDDTLTKKGRKVDSYQRFFDSWKVGKVGACASVSRKRQPKKQNGDQCASDFRLKVTAMNTCNVLKVPILRPCHRQVPIITYYRSCITDTCSCESDNCHCRAIQAYVSECRRFGIKIDSWQSVAKCTGVQPLAPAADIVPEKPRCPPGQIFSPCVNNCRKTCAALRQKSVNCNSNCSAGCQCPGNSVLHNNRCIPGKLCPSHQEVSMFYNSTLS